MTEETRREKKSTKVATQQLRGRQGKHTSLFDYIRGTDENNLAEFPLALLTDSAPINQKTLEFQDTIKDWKTGQEITRRVCITASDKFGLPTAKDDQVLVALLQLTDIANKFSSPEVAFTKHQVIKLLDWDNSTWAYERVEESLHRWKGVSVHYWNAWRDHGSQTWTDTEAIGVIDYFKISDGRRSRGTNNQRVQSRFVWNRELFKSFQAGYTKPLDFRLYRSLKRPAAQRAFRFLDKRFHHQPDWEFDLRTFACEKLGFSRNYDTGQLKARLHPAMSELEQAGFIEPVSYRKVRPKTWSVLVSKRVAKERLAKEEVAASTIPIVEKLNLRGVAKATAANLVEQFSPELIEEKIQYVDWLAARKDKRAPANMAGFLVAAIRNDYPPPKDFLKTRDKRTKRERTVAAPQLREQPPDNSVSAYLANLSLVERAELEVAAVKAADPIAMEGYHRSRQSGGPAFAAYQTMLIERYVRHLLSSGSKAA